MSTTKWQWNHQQQLRNVKIKCILLEGYKLYKVQVPDSNMIFQSSSIVSGSFWALDSSQLQADTSRDGRIDFEEFQAIMQNKVPVGTVSTDRFEMWLWLVFVSRDLKTKQSETEKYVMLCFCVFLTLDGQSNLEPIVLRPSWLLWLLDQYWAIPCNTC